MVNFRILSRLLTGLGLVASGCGQATTGPPLVAPFAEDMAADSRFSFNGVDITDRRAVAQVDSDHTIIASTRLLHPERYLKGVQCDLQIMGESLEGRMAVTCGSVSGTLIPDRDGRVSIKGDFQMPDPPSEYEIQIVITDSKAKFVVGRVPLFVIPAPEP